MEEVLHISMIRARDKLFDRDVTWKQRGNCAGMDPGKFFPPQGTSSKAVRLLILETCSYCPVREDCLQYAIETGEDEGIWGGMTARDRRPLRREWLESVA